MAKKEDVLDRRTLDRYRKQISDDFDKNYREKIVTDLSEEVFKDVEKNFDREYKERLVSEVTDEVKVQVKESMDKEVRKVSAHKSFKIFRLSVYIIVLLACIIYVIFRLYKTDNFDVMKYDYTKPSTSQVVTEEATTEKKEEIDYKALYGYLIDNIKVYDTNLYKGSYKVTDMTLENRLQIAYSALSKDDVEIDGAIYTLRTSTLKSAYNKLFDLDDFENTSFKVNDLNYIYSPNKNEYIAIVNDPVTDNIKYELADVTVDDNNIYVKALTAKVSGDKLYNINTNKEVGNNDDSLSNYKNKLSTLTFVFNKDKKLTSIIGE